jgi:hypothetical protein
MASRIRVQCDGDIRQNAEHDWPGFWSSRCFWALRVQTRRHIRLDGRRELTVQTDSRCGGSEGDPGSFKYDKTSPHWRRYGAASISHSQRRFAFNVSIRADWTLGDPVQCPRESFRR